MEATKKLLPFAIYLAPLAAMAATIQEVIDTIGNIIQSIVPLLITIALIVFIWGVIKYITAGADEGEREKARNVIMYGIIGLFAIVAVWGLVAMLKNTFGITETTTDIPQYTF